MKDFYQQKLVTIWQKAVNLYKSGNCKVDSFPIDDDLPFLTDMGMKKIDVFDFAEDWICEGEPDLATFVLIHDQRRDYFWEVQNKVPSTNILDTGTLPAKDAEIGGIRWLPRIIPKARAKLKGGLPRETMFCCGGDRNFFHQNRIHPSEFLALIRRAKADNQKIIDWVVQRAKRI